MDFKTMHHVSGMTLIVAVAIPGAFWYCVAFLCVFYTGIAMWLGHLYKRRHRRRRR